MRLPNAEQAEVDREKIAGYLLSTTNPRNRGKAGFFLRFGFRGDSWQDFAKALRLHGVTHEIATIIETEHGLRYYVEGIVETPDGRNPRVRTVWQVDIGSDHPRFITAHPLRR